MAGNLTVRAVGRMGGLLAALLACGCGGQQVLPVNSQAELDWRIRREDRPLLVKFYKAWCPACMRFAPMYSRLAEEHRDRAVFAAVDSSRDPDMEVRYGIGGYPTVVLFLKGRELERWIDKRSEQLYRDGIDRALAQVATGDSTRRGAGPASRPEGP